VDWNLNHCTVENFKEIEINATTVRCDRLMPNNIGPPGISFVSAAAQLTPSRSHFQNSQSGASSEKQHLTG
jgi:hypothetical protein